MHESTELIVELETGRLLVKLGASSFATIATATAAEAAPIVSTEAAFGGGSTNGVIPIASGEDMLTRCLGA